MQFGIKNEIDFAHYIDHKMIKDLPKQFQKLIYSLFKNANENSKVDCWKSKRNEKADIKLKINGEVKGISIKTGHNCSIHQEQDESLYQFFIKIGLESKIITYIKNFIDGHLNNVRVDAKTYINHNRQEIEEIKEALNDYYIKVNLLIRFLFIGTEKQNYDCDAIIYGTPENFLWATKSELLKYLMETKTLKQDRINISSLSLKCYDRNLRNNPSRVVKEKQIQIKWYEIEDDLKNIANNRKKA